MSFFNSYKRKVACGKIDKEYQECLITEDIIKDFEVSPSYQQVYKNLDYLTLYDTQINDVNKFKATVGDKDMLSYPYDEVKFRLGDYISYADATKDLTHWVLVALDTQHLYRIKGEITKCNNIFKFVDDLGNLYEYPCIIESSFASSGLSDDKHMIIPEGRFRIVLQLNDDTVKIKEDTRVLLNNLDFQDSKYGVQAVRVTDFVNMSEKRFLKLYVEKDQINRYVDDVENLIANRYFNNYLLTINQDDFNQSIGHTDMLDYTLTNNGNEVENSTILWSSSDDTIGTIDVNGNIELLAIGTVVYTATYEDVTDISDSISVDVVAIPSGVVEIRIEPNITEILLGDTQEYVVNKYVDNVVQVDTFTMTVNDVPIENYELNIIDGNTFTVKNISMYPDDTLDITCTSDVDSAFEVIEIKLKGAW